MRKLFFFVASAIFSFMAMLLSGCASTAGNMPSTAQQARPVWIDNHPSSDEYFIGVGNGRMEGDPVAAQESARMIALGDIARQIEVTIISDIKLNDSNVTINNRITTDQSVYQNKIRSLAQAALADWEIKATWNGPDGYYYCKVILEKKKYYDRINKKVNDAMALAVDAIAASEQGSFDARLRELYKGLTALDDFPGIVIKTVIGGKEAILNNELPRRLQQLLSGVGIRPNITTVTLSAAAPAPDTLGMMVFVNNRPEPDISLAWSSPVPAIEPVGMPVRPDGLHPVLLKSIPASAGVVQVAAAVDCGALTNDLLKRKFTIPYATFTISRKIPRIFMAGNGDFGNRLMDRLTSVLAARAAQSRGEADFIFSANSSPAGEPTPFMGIYKAKTIFNILLMTVGGRRILDIHEEISSAARDASGAQDNADKLALEKAVELVEKAF